MQTTKFPLSPPSLAELAQALQGPLAANYADATVSVVPCPDLREAPFHLASSGLCGSEKIADIGGQAHLFPRPRLDRIYSLVDVAQAMDMDSAQGSLIGAGAGPFHVVGQNCELAPNLSWSGGWESVSNQTWLTRIERSTRAVRLEQSASLDCALMANVFGSEGERGPVLKITARKRTGAQGGFAQCIQRALREVYGAERTVSLGGVFVVKSGCAKYHVMPDFPAEEELPFRDRAQLERWLTYHEFRGPMVCLSVLHSADPGGKMRLRMEHTHCFSAVGDNAGGHYHYDVEGEVGEDVEYEAYFNTAKAIYRVDMPQ